MYCNAHRAWITNHVHVRPFPRAAMRIILMTLLHLALLRVQYKENNINDFIAFSTARSINVLSDI